jgi:AhpD family alkylhydroperoxidase
VDKKIEEMVALGASYVLNCRPCMEYHKKAAAEAGLSREEMQSAIRVAEAVREGAGKKNREFSEDLFGPINEERCCPAGSACCA